MKEEYFYKKTLDLLEIKISGDDVGTLPRDIPTVSPRKRASQLTKSGSTPTRSSLPSTTKPSTPTPTWGPGNSEWESMMHGRGRGRMSGGIRRGPSMGRITTPEFNSAVADKGLQALDIATTLAPIPGAGPLGAGRITTRLGLAATQAGKEAAKRELKKKALVRGARELLPDAPTTPRTTPTRTTPTRTTPTPTTPTPARPTPARPTPAGTPPPRGKPPGRTGTSDPPGDPTPRRGTGAPKGPTPEGNPWTAPIVGTIGYGIYKNMQGGGEVQAGAATQAQRQQVGTPKGTATGTQTQPGKRKPTKRKIKIPVPKIVQRGGHVRGKRGTPEGRQFARTTQQGDEDELPEMTMSNIYKRIGVLLEAGYGENQRDRDIQKWADDHAREKRGRTSQQQASQTSRPWGAGVFPHIKGPVTRDAINSIRRRSVDVGGRNPFPPASTGSKIRHAVGTPIQPQDIRSGAANPNPSPAQSFRRTGTGSASWGGKPEALGGKGIQWGFGRTGGRPGAALTDRGKWSRTAMNQGLIRRGTLGHQIASPLVAGGKDMWKKIRGLSGPKSGGTVGLR